MTGRSRWWLRTPTGARVRKGLGYMRRRARMAQDNLVARAKGGPRLVHVGVHRAANAGDIVLLDATRAVVAQGTAPVWTLTDVHEPLTSAGADRISRRADGLLLGGGGLFLGDTNANLVSGWQWPAGPDAISRLTVPIAVFGVGYNRFRGQDRLPAIFTESLEALVSKSFFFGVRNRGSLAELRGYLPDHFAPRICYQPCPTTGLWQLFPHTPPQSHGQRTLALNVAFDRRSSRYGSREHEVCASIARVTTMAHQDGWRISVALHAPSDDGILPYLDAEGIDYEVAHLAACDTARVVSYYSGVDLVIGMRGHAQLIPFGLGVPIMSLVSHNKMAWFLEDIGQPTWGVDVTTPDFEDHFLQAYRRCAAELDTRRAEVAIARERLWTITESNARIVATGLSGTGAGGATRT